MLMNKHLRHILYIGLATLMAVSSVPVAGAVSSPALGTITAQAKRRHHHYLGYQQRNIKKVSKTTYQRDAKGNIISSQTVGTEYRKKHRAFNPNSATSKENNDYINRLIRRRSVYLGTRSKLKTNERHLHHFEVMAQKHPHGHTHKVEMSLVNKYSRRESALTNAYYQEQDILNHPYNKVDWGKLRGIRKQNDSLIKDSHTSASVKAQARKENTKITKMLAMNEEIVKKNDAWNRAYSRKEIKLAARLNSPQTNPHISASNGAEAAEGYGQGVIPWQVRQNPRAYGRGYVEGLEYIGWSKRNANIAWRLLHRAVQRHPNRSSFWISEDVYTGDPKVMSD